MEKPQIQFNPTVALTINFDQTTGAVRVDGPIENRLLCYGMMELAKEAIQRFAQEKAAGTKILTPHLAFPGARQ